MPKIADLVQIGFNPNQAKHIGDGQFDGGLIATGLKASTSAGLLFEANNGTDVALFGAGGGAGVTHYGDVLVPDNAYSSGWDGSTAVPTRNAVYDKIESLNIISGTYTPTATNTANLGTVGVYSAQYLRVGNTVTVSGKVDIDATTTATGTGWRLTLPIASNFTNERDLCGVINGFSPTEAGIVRGDSTNDAAQFEVIVQTASNHAMYYTYTYRIA